MQVIRIASVVAMIASGLIGGSNPVANATTTSIVPTGAGFRNISKTLCNLKGYPSLQMFDTSGHRISTHIIQGPSGSVPNIAANPASRSYTLIANIHALVTLCK